MGDPRFKNLELKVGLFIFVAIAMIAFMVIGFLVTQDVFTRKVKVVFIAESGEGLSKSMPVMYSGFQLARVHKIELRDDGLVELRANIPERYNKWIKSDSVTTVQAQGVIGANTIVFSGGNDAGVIDDGQTYQLLREKAITDLLMKVEPMINDVKSILENVDEVTESVTTKRKEFESFMDGFGAVGEDLTNKQGSVGYLVRSDYLKNEVEKIVNKIKTIEDNIEKITLSVNSRVDETKPVIQNFDKGLIAIKEGTENISTLARNLDKTVAETVETIQPTLKNTNKITTDIADTTTNLADIREQTDEILNTTNRILLNLEERWPFNDSNQIKTDEKVQLP